jgi:hypothetical protein
MRTQLLQCPTCDGVAEVDWRSQRQRGRELVKIRCIRKHWFLMPADELVWYPENGAAGDAAA